MDFTEYEEKERQAHMEVGHAMRKSEMPEGETPTKHIIIYICPTEECGNHYAAPNFRPDRMDMEAVQVYRGQEGERISSHTRRECPDCRRIRGIHVERVAFIVTQVVPLAKVLKARIKAQQPQKERVG